MYKHLLFLLILLKSAVFAQPELLLGGIIRGDKSEKNIHIVMTSHEFVDGYDTISAVLNRHSIKASFFFTGDFYRTDKFAGIIKSLKEGGHYLGAHSDKHILYCSWENRDSTLVTRDEFNDDVLNNYREMEKFGIKKSDAPFYLPPYEWYNTEISQWTKDLGLQLVNFTPGTSSNQDWTIPSMNEKYLSSDSILSRVMKYEQKDPYGLNGFILLIHFGTHPERTDKFYLRLDELISSLKEKGYSFKLLTETLGDYFPE